MNLYLAFGIFTALYVWVAFRMFYKHGDRASGFWMNVLRANIAVFAYAFIITPLFLLLFYFSGDYQDSDLVKVAGGVGFYAGVWITIMPVVLLWAWFRYLKRKRLDEILINKP